MGLPSALTSDAVDVRLYLQTSQQPELLDHLYKSPYLADNGQPILTVHRTSSQGFWFHYCDGTCFHINQNGSEVFATWPDGLTLEDTTVYFYGPILGFILRLRGVVSLHASGVLLPGGAIGLIGPPGAGKSTTAACLVQSGFRGLTDDVFALIDGPQGFRVQPAYPGIRLWPESVQNLWGSADALPRLTPNWEKRYLNLEAQPDSNNFQPLPIAAVYFLGERIDDPRAPYIESVPLSLLDLLANTYAGYALTPQMRAHEFDLLTRFANSVPARKLVPHADAAQLPKLCHLLRDDMSSRRSE